MKRWYIAGLLFLASVINYIDRQTLSVLAPVLTRELHLSPVAYSNILNAFLVCYTVMYVGSGFLVDRWGTRVSLAVFMVFWSASNMLHAFARSAVQLGLFRALLGIAEPGNFMAGFRAISEWFPASERGFVNGLQNAGSAIGAVIAAPLVVWLAVRYGWQYAFLITGALGFVWVIPWLLLYHVPAQIVQAGPVENIGKVSISELLRAPQTRGLLFAKLLSDPVWWFYLFWLPKYLVEQRHFSLVEMGLLAWLPYLTADIGSFAGGILSGWLVTRGWQPLSARKLMLLPFALMMPLSCLVPYVPAAAAMAIISLVTFAHMGWKTNLTTITNDIYPTRLVGSVSGVIAFGGGIGATLFTSLTGEVVEHSSYQMIFLIMSFLHPLAYLVVRWLVTPNPGLSGTVYAAPSIVSGSSR